MPPWKKLSVQMPRPNPYCTLCHGVGWIGFYETCWICSLDEQAER